MRRFVTALALLATGYGAITTAAAETLDDALAAAYASNPQLQARRAQGRATDEQVTQALSNWRPTVSLSLKGGKGAYESNSAADQVRTPRAGSVTISQPLYRGGRTVAATEQAEKLVLAERSQLANVEQTVLLAAAQAYLDVVQNKAVLDLTASNEKVLQRQLQATNDRFRVGEITRTSVAQAEARLAKATADRLAAEGTLQASRATYERVTGAMPGALTLPPHPTGLPTSLEESVSQAQAANPTVTASDLTAQASQHGVELVRGELRPTVSLDGTLGRGWRQSSLIDRTQTTEAVVKVSVPLYEAGAVYSRLREAKHTAGQRRLETDLARRTAVESAAQAWDTLAAARAQIKSIDTQVNSATLALEGVQAEAQVGSRTVLDVLNAEQELSDARVSLARAQHDELMAEYRLLAAVGRLTAADLRLPVELYDPSVHYQDTRGQWLGTSSSAEADAKVGKTQ